MCLLERRVPVETVATLIFKRGVERKESRGSAWTCKELCSRGRYVEVLKLKEGTQTPNKKCLITCVW